VALMRARAGWVDAVQMFAEHLDWFSRGYSLASWRANSEACSQSGPTRS
jgi:hypothetical protein